MITDAEGLTCMLLGTTSRMAAASMKPAPSEISEFRTGLRTSRRDDMIHPPIRFARDAAMPRTRTVSSRALIFDCGFRIVADLRIADLVIADFGLIGFDSDSSIRNRQSTNQRLFNPQSTIHNPKSEVLQSEIRNPNFP